MKIRVDVSLAIVAALSVVVQSGFLVTSPRIFRTGNTYKLAVNLINTGDPWIVSATIRNHWRNAIASDKGKFNSTDERVLILKIPRDVNIGPHKQNNAKLSVTGGPEGEKPVFQKTEVVTLEIAKKSLFIQTDKPIYKPGQTIRMRIVGVDENLRPLTGKVSRVTILNPSGVRTMQWDNLDFTVGIVSLELPLSSQPVLGNWAIEATVQGQKKKQVIVVEKYVLPKFEVNIQPPSFIARDTKEVTATVCARYTYGQPVVGRVNVLISTQRRNITFEKEINGCTDVTILGSHLDISSHLSGKVHINATVTERGTGVTQNATGTVTDVVQYSTNIEFLPTTPNTFKPGMPFRGQMKVTKPDGSPATGEKVVLTVVGNPRNHWWYVNQNKLLKQTEIVPGSGIVDFVVPGRLVQSKYRFLLLKAKPIRAKDSNWRYNNVEHHATPWYSPSNSYVEIEKMTAPVKVGSMAKVKFYFTADKNTNSISFHYQVLSRGKLVEQGQKHQQVVLDDQSVGSGYIQFTVTQEMVPSCRVLLFYVREDGETVADFTLLDVADTLENEVTISFADETRKPGEATKLTIAAAPGSLVAITAVDKSVHLLRGGNELTENDAIGVLSGQDVGPDEDYRRRESCFQPRWWPSLRRRRSIGPYWAESSGADASKAFADSGVIYFSDLKIETAECHRLRPYGRPEPMFERMQLAAGPLSVAAIGNLGPQIPPKKKAKNQAKKAQLNIRKQFPETWLWTEEVVNEKTGKVVIRAKVPDTITSWTASAFALSSLAGFGVSSPTSIKVFQPFFVSLTLPYSVIRGEEVSITTSVFNYMDKCLTIRLDFLSSEDYKVISDDSHKVCVCSNEAKSVRFIINPKNLGYIPLTVVAKNIDSSVCKKDLKQMTLGVTDAVIRKLLVEPEGVRQEYTYNSFVCLDDEKPFFTDAINVSLPSNVVPGSVHAVVSTIGDLMGPALNVGTMLRLPYGCGEQNMVNFAPGIYIMKYLSSVDQLSPKIETKAKTIMRSGYQRELTYKRKDGSYSAFGESDREGNMWLTAFVLRSFAQARPFIFVDVDELKETTAWITKHQKPDGCFPSVGRLFNKRLKGGVSTEATLTAFVSVSLMERGMAPENKVIRKALQCVVQASQNLSDSYSAALFAYTLALARDPRRLQFFKVLQDKAIIEGDLMHWEKVKETEPTILPPWRWYYRAPAADIEMTAYALMTYVLMAEDDTSLIGEAQPIVRWLSKQRNSLGGFSSTQDTCVALQALSKYASNVYSNSTDLTVRFGDQEVYNYSKTFNITNNNRLVSQRAQLTSDLLPILDLPVEVKGSGCALLQADVSYNVPEVEEKPAFDLRVRVKRSDNVFASHLTTETGDELCGPLEMEIAARWLRENTSNMAIIDVKMVSGFQADVDSLEKLKNMPRLKFKRYEIEGAHVVMYFDEIGTVSFSFKIYQSAIVKKTKPASVTVYDYYETEMSAIETYKIKEALCAPETIDPPPECPICLKGLNPEGEILSKLCKTKKVYALVVGKRDNAVYQEIPKPNVTAGGDVNNTSNANERSNATSTAVEFQLNIPTDCKCPILHPGSELYAFVDGVELVPISDNAVLVQRRSLNLGRLWRNLHARCPRNP